MPLRDWYVGADQRQTLWLLIGAVAIVLLTACANVANLLLAWGSARREEFAVRLTLGSSRMRMMSQLLAEFALLALGGVVLGLALAVWARETFVNLLPPGSPFRLMPIETDWRVVSYSVGVAMVSVLVAGLAPLRHALRVESRFRARRACGPDPTTRLTSRGADRRDGSTAGGRGRARAQLSQGVEYRPWLLQGKRVDDANRSAGRRSGQPAGRLLRRSD